jgi:adenosine kinase
MRALICGSIAYDNIMVFHDYFKNHILPEKTHMLNLSFVVPDMNRELGGCAGNIVYSMKLLEEDALPMATVGIDFDIYRERFQELNIDCRYIKVIEDKFTAQCFITTDLAGNQINFFQIGAMGYSHENSVPGDDGVSIGIVAPDGKEGMLSHAEQFASAGIPFFFDPGQNVPLIERDEMLTAFDQANWIVFNDYEWQQIEDKTGLTTNTVNDLVEALIVTRGGEGSIIYTKNSQYEIPPVTTSELVDPTGCGDAYRAGLLYGLMNEMDWETTGRIASLVGAFKIEKAGAQNHQFSKQEFADRFEESFGYMLS